MAIRQKKSKKAPEPKPGPQKRNKKGLSVRETLFIDKYLEIANIEQSAIYAGYKASSAGNQGRNLLQKQYIKDEIAKRQERMKKSSIATAQQVMEYLTRVMNGEEKDQFGLDAPLAERTRAAVELAKRTVDIDNRVNGKADAVVEIKLDWGQE